MKDFMYIFNLSEFMYSYYEVIIEKLMLNL